MGELLCIIDSEIVREICPWNHFGVCEKDIKLCQFQGKR